MKEHTLTEKEYQEWVKHQEKKSQKATEGRLFRQAKRELIQRHMEEFARIVSDLKEKEA